MFEGDNPEILSICLLSLHRVEAVDILAQTAELSLNKQKSQQIDDNATLTPLVVSLVCRGGTHQESSW